MSESKRLFFAVNIPEEAKQQISEKLLPLVPADGWGKVPQENLHVTMLFLGHMPAEAVERLAGQAEALKNFCAFEAELQGTGHFNGKVLWVGFGKGNGQIVELCKKLQAAVNMKDERFHPHVTLARNKRSCRREALELAEKMQKTGFKAAIQVNSVELMESMLQRPAPKYAKVFSVRLAAAKRQP